MCQVALEWSVTEGASLAITRHKPTTVDTSATSTLYCITIYINPAFLAPQGLALPLFYKHQRLCPLTHQDINTAQAASPPNRVPTHKRPDKVQKCTEPTARRFFPTFHEITAKSRPCPVLVWEGPLLTSTRDNSKCGAGSDGASKACSSCGAVRLHLCTSAPLRPSHVLELKCTG